MMRAYFPLSATALIASLHCVNADAAPSTKQRERDRVKQETTSVVAPEDYKYICVDGADGIPCGGPIEQAKIKKPNKKWHKVKILEPVRTEWRLSVHPEGQRIDYFRVSASETDAWVERFLKLDGALLGKATLQDPRPGDQDRKVRYDFYRLGKQEDAVHIGYYWNPSETSQAGYICRHVSRKEDLNASWRLRVGCSRVLEEAHRRSLRN